MKRCCLLIMFIFSRFAFSQVGINTNKPQSMLHLNNTDTNKVNSALRIEGEIKKEISDVSVTNKDMFFDSNGNLFSTPQKLYALNLVVSLIPAPRDVDLYTCLSSPLGNSLLNIRRVNFGRVVFSSFNPVRNVFDVNTGVFTVPKTGYYQINVNLGLRHDLSNQVGAYMYRVGVFLVDDNESNQKDTFILLDQGPNKGGSFNGVNHPEFLHTKGVIYLQKNQKIAAGTRFITLSNTDAGGVVCDTDRINYKRENVNTMIITFLNE